MSPLTEGGRSPDFATALIGCPSGTSVPTFRPDLLTCQGGVDPAGAVLGLKGANGPLEGNMGPVGAGTGAA